MAKILQKPLPTEVESATSGSESSLKWWEKIGKTREDWAEGPRFWVFVIQTQALSSSDLPGHHATSSSHQPFGTLGLGGPGMENWVGALSWGHWPANEQDKWVITGGDRDSAIETSSHLGLERQKTPCLVQQQLLQTILQVSSLGTPEQLPQTAFFLPGTPNFTGYQHVLWTMYRSGPVSFILPFYSAGCVCCTNKVTMCDSYPDPRLWCSTDMLSPCAWR